VFKNILYVFLICIIPYGCNLDKSTQCLQTCYEENTVEVQYVTKQCVMNTKQNAIRCHNNALQAICVYCGGFIGF